MPAAPEIERANTLRWDLKKRGHYEVYYITLNHIKSGSGFWIRYTMNSPEEGRGGAYAQVWFARFCYTDPGRNFAVRRRFALDEMKANQTPFHLRIGDCELSNGRVVGGLDGLGHETFWDISFTPSPTVYRHLPKLFYTEGLADTVALSPNPHVRFTGVIRADGVKYELKNDLGCQTHLWGKKHAHRWAWAHCGSFAEDPGAMFEGISVQVKRLGLAVPPLSFINIRYRGRDYAFNSLLSPAVVRGNFDTGLWRFSAAAGNTLFRGEISSRFQDLIRASYLYPDGEDVFCHNSETGSASIQVFRRQTIFSPWKHVDTITSLAAANVEFASREPHPDVRIEFEDLP